MVMPEDGRKMSKRLRNYTPPDDLMEMYGADALRLYLINSGLVRGEEQRFADNGVKDMTRRTLLPWYNAFQFLMTYATIDGWSPDKGLHYGSNILDQWILSRLQTLEKDIGQEMRKYRLYNVVPRLLEFIEDLTNGYIRLNRDRFWGKDITADKIAAYSTLYTVIEELTMVMAPFTPFLAEHLYQELAKLKGQGAPKPSLGAFVLVSGPGRVADAAAPRGSRQPDAAGDPARPSTARGGEDQSAQADALADHRASGCGHAERDCARSSRSSVAS